MMDIPKVIWVKGMYLGGHWENGAGLLKTSGGVKFIRADAPELLAMVRALEKVLEMASHYKPTSPEEIEAQRVLTQWKALR